MKDTFYVVSEELHNQLVGQVFENRGFDRQEAKAVAEFAAFATRHGVRTHNALKALHLDELFGSAVGGCKPRAQVEIKESRFDACQDVERQSQSRSSDRLRCH